jgi:hypothetical protein
LNIDGKPYCDGCGRKAFIASRLAKKNANRTDNPIPQQSAPVLSQPQPKVTEPPPPINVSFPPQTRQQTFGGSFLEQERQKELEREREREKERQEAERKRHELERVSFLALNICIEFTTDEINHGKLQERERQREKERQEAERKRQLELEQVNSFMFISNHFAMITNKT